MAIVLPTDVDLRDALSRACDDNKLCGLNPSIDWRRASYDDAVADWYASRDYKDDTRTCRAPTEAETQAAANAIAAERAVAVSEKSDADAERSNAQSALSTLTNVKDQASFTNAQRDSVIRLLCRLMLFVLKRELKR